MWHSQPWPTTTPPQSTLSETPTAPTAMRRMSRRSILDGMMETTTNYSSPVSSEYSPGED